jgi:Holliday junction DNA helicase RuvA
MIHTLRGRIAERGDDFLVTDVQGVGFKVFMNGRAAAEAPEGGEVKLFTHLYVREDRLDLYGFLNESALKLFELLISVSGVGPKSALAVLDVDTAENIIAAIAGKRPDILTRASGIGMKTAERIVLELENRIKIPKGVVATTTRMDENSEVEEALVGLGYGRPDVRRAMSGIPKDKKGLEEKLRETLKILGRRT